MWEVKKTAVKSHRILPACGCKARGTMVAKCELVLYGNSLTGPAWRRTFHFKDLMIIFGPKDTVALFANEARVFQILGVLPGMFSPKRSQWVTT